MSDVKSPLLCIPLEKLPECWNDESRINVLFAPFRSRNANPQDWDSKLAFWRKMIALYCEYSKTYCFTVPLLLKVFNRNGRSPACLEDVVNEMYRLKEIKLVHEFREAPSRTWTAWAAQVLVKKPATWTFNVVKNSLVERDKNVEYVHLAAIEEAEKELLIMFPEELKGKAINFQKLIDILEWPSNKVDSLQLVLHGLLCKGKADIKELNSNNKEFTQALLRSHLVKIENASKLKLISELDISTHILEENEKLLLDNVEKQEKEINNIREDAKSYLKKGHKQMAKSLLIKKRELEKRLIKEANALHNVQMLLGRIQGVESDAEVLSSYKMALSTLQNNFKETGLTEDAVTETMISLGDILDIHDDIQSSLSKPVYEENMEELEEELAELIEQEEQKGATEKETEEGISDLEKRLEALKLPDVPSASPSQTKSKISL